MTEEQDRPFNVDEQLAERKMERWGSNDNFVAPRELTLTITLGEYRNLISENSRLSNSNSQLREIADSRLKEIQTRDTRIAELENQVAELQHKLTTQI
jgi:hypothetical protein